MRTKTNKIFFNGCSYTYGIGVADFTDVYGIQNNRYSKLVANHFNMIDDNAAQPGSCNQRIARNTFTQCTPDETSLAIIMWSDPPRTEIFRPQENEYHFQDLAQITPQGANGTQSYEHREALLHYFTYIHSEERALIHTLYNMMSVEAYFREKNIPVMHLHYKGNFNRVLRHVLQRCEDFSNNDESINLKREIENSINYLSTNKFLTGVNDNINFNDMVKHIPYSTISLGHPDKEGHKLYSEWLINYIEESNVIS